MNGKLAEELKAQLEGTQKFHSYKNKSADVQYEISGLRDEIEVLTKALKKEDQDVESLKKGGLQAFYLKVRGKYDETMDREVLEAANAKVKLENKEFELEDAKRRLRGLQEEQVKYSGCEAKYKELYQRKMEELLLEENETKITILEFQRKCSEAEHNIKELKEAVSAGNRVLNTLKQVEDSLGCAKGWGTWDMLGGGMVSGMMKHSYLDDAKTSLNQVQRLMGDFRTELADVRMTLDIQIDTDGFSRFADFFFDNIFSDYNMQNRIHQAQRSVDTAKGKVNRTLVRLKQLEATEKSNRKSYQEKIETIVNNA